MPGSYVKSETLVLVLSVPWDILARLAAGRADSRFYRVPRTPCRCTRQDTAQKLHMVTRTPAEISAYLEEHGLRAKLEDALTSVVKAAVLPANPFTALVAAFSFHEAMTKAKLVFQAADVDGSGELDRKELFAKLKADGEIETLLGRKDVAGEGLDGVKAMGRILVSLDSDDGDMGLGIGKVTWAEFEGAVRFAQTLQRAKTVFDGADVDGSGSLDRSELFAKLQADGDIEQLLNIRDIKGEGLAGAKAMGKVLKSLSSGADGDLGENVGKVTFEQFEAAVKAALKSGK